MGDVADSPGHSLCSVDYVQNDSSATEMGERDRYAGDEIPVWHNFMGSQLHQD